MCVGLGSALTAHQLHVYGGGFSSLHRVLVRNESIVLWVGFTLSGTNVLGASARVVFFFWLSLVGGRSGRGRVPDDAVALHVAAAMVVASQESDDPLEQTLRSAGGREILRRDVEGQTGASSGAGDIPPSQKNSPVRSSERGYLDRSSPCVTPLQLPWL